MIDVSEIRKIVESSPQISIDLTSQITSHISGLRNAFNIKKNFIIDYEKEEAKVFTSIIGVEGQSEIRELFHNQEKKVSVYGLNGLLLDSHTETITQDEYSALFSHTGGLCIVDFDMLVPNGTNNMSFHAKATPKCMDFLSNNAVSEDDIDMFSNILLTICSEDTLKINSLAYGKLKNMEDSLLITDSEIIIHLSESNNLLF